MLQDGVVLCRAVRGLMPLIFHFVNEPSAARHAVVTIPHPSLSKNTYWVAGHLLNERLEQLGYDTTIKCCAMLRYVALGCCKVGMLQDVTVGMLEWCSSSAVQCCNV